MEQPRPIGITTAKKIHKYCDTCDFWKKTCGGKNICRISGLITGKFWHCDIWRPKTDEDVS